MRRREFLSLIGSVAALPTVARAQQPDRKRRIGVLLVAGPEPIGPYREALGDLGYLDGGNVQYEVRSAQGRDAHLPELAAELVSSGVDIIIAVQTPAAHAAKAATRDIPIVVMAGDPIGTGLINNHARPGGNITGLSVTAVEAVGKSLELITEIVPGARRVGVLGNSDDPFMKPYFEQIARAAAGVRLEIHRVAVSGSDPLNGAFAAMARERVDAVVIQGSLPNEPAVDLALRYQLPSISTQKSAVRAGMLMSYSASFAERGRVIASYVDKILKGAKPADLPVQQPNFYELTVNLKTAKALGITFSPSLLVRADEVIE